MSKNATANRTTVTGSNTYRIAVMSSCRLVGRQLSLIHPEPVYAQGERNIMRVSHRISVTDDHHQTGRFPESCFHCRRVRLRGCGRQGEMKRRTPTGVGGCP